MNPGWSPAITQRSHVEQWRQSPGNLALIAETPIFCFPLQPGTGCGILTKQRSLANIVARDGDRAVAGLVHDRALTHAGRGDRGRELRAQAVAAELCRVQAGRASRALDGPCDSVGRQARGPDVAMAGDWLKDWPFRHAACIQPGAQRPDRTGGRVRAIWLPLDAPCPS